MRIINFGSLNIDYVYRLNHIVRPGETISSTSMEKFAGGKGLNQSIAIARADGDVVHAGFYGNEGQFLHKMLAENGVDVNWLRKVDAANGHAIIQVDNMGENSIVLFTGTNGMVEETYIDHVFESTTGNELILFQNETSAIGYGMKVAKDKGCIIAFNPAPMNEKVLEYPLELVDIFVVNLTEGQMLSGQVAPDRILDTLKEKYPKAKVILTLGEDGAWFSDINNRCHINAVEVDKVIDTTAAGDTFIGYYLANMDKSDGDITALELATKAASICIGRMGAAASIPSCDELG